MFRIKSDGMKKIGNSKESQIDMFGIKYDGMRKRRWYGNSD